MPERPYTLRRGLYVVGQGIRRAPATFAVAVVGSFLYGVMTAGTAWVLSRVTAQVIAPAFRTRHVDVGALGRGAGLMVAVLVLLVVGVVLRRVAAGRMMFDLGALYRREVTAQYLRLPLSWHARHPTGQLLSNANADVEATWQVFGPLPMAIGVVVMLVVAIVAMVLADPLLALIGLCVFPVEFVVNVLFQRSMAPRATLAQQLRADVSDVAHESFEAAVLVKAMGREAAETRRFAAVSHRLRAANVEVGRMRGVFDPLMEAIPSLGTLAVLGVGASRVASGATTAADVVQVAYLFSLMAFPVRALGWVLGELPRSVVGWERVDAVLRAEGALAYGDTQLSAAGAAAVAFAHVDYAYADAQGRALPALRDVTFQVAPGTTVAVVGPTGSGKSTLAALLLRLVDPDRGVVTLDGVDLAALPAGALADAVALVAQQTFVFDDSVRANITLGDPGLHDDDDRRVWAALRLARADDFVAALPHGLDTQVGERGTALSGGQRQRLALARALVRRPRLLVLDDATSAVDPHVEAEILAGLRTGARGASVLLVAHRKATIALADTVVHLEGGRVVGTGSHADLSARSPAYRDLVDAYEREAADRQRAEGAAAVGPDAEVSA